VGASGAVGVGTGGAVSGGSGSWEASVGGVVTTPVGGLVTSPETAGPTGVETAVEGDTDGISDGTVVTADDVTAAGDVWMWRAGASPIPPAPPGESTATERVAGVASCQPTVTATGSPRATSPKKMDLGDNRT
jgi:hypothetical protein